MDWNATAPLLDEAREAFLRVSFMPGNPSSVHNEGRAIRREIETARRLVAEAVGGKAANVTFTSGATRSRQSRSHAGLPHGKGSACRKPGFMFRRSSTRLCSTADVFPPTP